MSAADAISPPLTMTDSAKTDFPSPQSPPTSGGERGSAGGPREPRCDARLREPESAAAVSIDDLLAHQELVFRVCLGYSRNYTEAEDLTQDVFLRAHLGLDRLRNPARARDWLLRIARNACLDLRKTDRLRAALLRLWGGAPEVSAAPEAAGEDIDLRLGRLKAAVGRLPRKLREVFVLREYGHLTYEELSGALSIKRGTVMSRLNRARARLTAELQETTHERP